MEQTEPQEPTGEWLFIASIKQGISILPMEQKDLQSQQVSGYL